MATKKRAASAPATAPARELYPTELAGESYMIRAPKNYVTLQLSKSLQIDPKKDMIGFTQGIENLIDAIFTKADAKKIRARLLDADDEIDIQDIAEAFTEVIEKSTGNPTT